MCLVCGDIEFPLKWRVERHLKEQHAGFSYKCLKCRKIFNRKNLQHGCTDLEDQDMVIFTRDGKRGEEAERDYEKYIKDVMPTQMKRVLKNHQEDKPPQEPLFKLEKRKVVEEESVPARKKSKPASIVRGSSSSSSSSSSSNSSSSSSRSVVSVEIQEEVVVPIYTAVPIESDKVGGASGGDQDVVVVDGTPSDAPIYSSVVRSALKSCQDAQDEKVMLNIGGSLFQTSKVSLRADPSSLFALMLLPQSPFKPNANTYFFDRDPAHFRIILNYLRNGALLDLNTLPRESRYLQELLSESLYYKLFGLRDLLKRRLVQVNSYHCPMESGDAS